MTMFTITTYRKSPFQGCRPVVKGRKVPKREKVFPVQPDWFHPAHLRPGRSLGYKLILFSQHRRSPAFPISQQLPLKQDVVSRAAAIIGCLVVTHGVVWSLMLPALIQSDSDRHIKMQILACALLAILSLPFSLCGMLRGEELECWPWGWIFKWPPDFPAEQQQQQPGLHLHSFPRAIYCLSTPNDSMSPFMDTSKSALLPLPPAQLCVLEKTITKLQTAERA